MDTVSAPILSSKQSSRIILCLVNYDSNMKVTCVSNFNYEYIWVVLRCNFKKTFEIWDPDLKSFTLIDKAGWKKYFFFFIL